MWYAIVKIAGINLYQAYRTQHGCDFISAMPTNLFGAGEISTLQAATWCRRCSRRCMRQDSRAQGRKRFGGLELQGRELLHVDDLSGACVHLLRHYSGLKHVNVGCGEGVTIAGLAELVRDGVGYQASWSSMPPSRTARP